MRRVDVIGGLKLYQEPIFENFFFQHDTIKLIIHQSLSNNLYAFGKWVRQLHIRCNSLTVISTDRITDFAACIEPLQIGVVS